MSRAKMYVMMAAAMMLAGPLNGPNRRVVESGMSEEEKQAKQREINLRKGLKEFKMGDGTVVWALNEKSAIRKHKKKKK